MGDDIHITGPYYFDTLPLHPPPKDFEALSSYIMRLMEENDLYQRSAFYKFLNIKINTAGDFTDYPHDFFNDIALLTTCSEAQLLELTLYHVGKKFGRSPHPPALSRFFGESLGKYLRYCPLCLAESAHYSLLWRFLSLVGCYIHNCRLLECCGHCGKTIPLFFIPSHMGMCPTCGKHLQSCRTTALTEQERVSVQRQNTELEYLLSPHEDEQENNRARLIGGRFRKLRQEKGDRQEVVAEALEVNVRTIKVLEQGTKERKVSFQTYTRYAHYLHVSLYNTLVDSSPFAQSEQRVIPRKEVTRLTLSKHEKRQRREQELFFRVQKAIQDLKELRQRVTLTAIGERVCVSPSILRTYPSVLGLWKQVSSELHEERRSQHEDELIKGLQQSMMQLKEQHQNLSKEAICAYLLMHSSTLVYYPRADAYLKQALDTKYDEKKLLNDEQSVVEQIQRVLAELKASKQAFTQEKMSNEVGISLFVLLQYPQVRTILEQATKDGRLERETQAQSRQQEIVEQVQYAVDHLKSLELPISRKAVAEQVGLTVEALRQYTAVRPLLDQVVQEYKQQTSHRTQQHEDELLERVQEAVLYLRQKELPITQEAIGEFVGCTDTALLYYQGFREFYKRVKQEEQHTRVQCAQQREEVLLAQIQSIIVEMNDQKQTITLTGIAERVGMVVNSLRKYPRINILFQQILDERRRDSMKRNQV